MRYWAADLNLWNILFAVLFAELLKINFNVFLLPFQIKYFCTYTNERTQNKERKYDERGVHCVFKWKLYIEEENNNKKKKKRTANYPLRIAHNNKSKTTETWRNITNNNINKVHSQV